MRTSTSASPTSCGCTRCEGLTGYEYGGRYKTDDNVILEIDEDGSRRVRFRPTPARETPRAMEQLELAYMAARDDANVNQLLLIPCVILDFLCIHPFRDGNGRMSPAALAAAAVQERL